MVLRHGYIFVIMVPLYEKETNEKFQFLQTHFVVKLSMDRPLPPGNVLYTDGHGDT